MLIYPKYDVFIFHCINQTKTFLLFHNNQRTYLKLILIKIKFIFLDFYDIN